MLSFSIDFYEDDTHPACREDVPVEGECLQPCGSSYIEKCAAASILIWWCQPYGLRRKAKPRKDSTLTTRCCSTSFTAVHGFDWLLIPGTTLCAASFQLLFVKLNVQAYHGGEGGDGSEMDGVNVAICTIEKANSIVNRLAEEKRLQVRIVSASRRR